MVSYSFEEAVEKLAPIGNPYAGDIIPADEREDQEVVDDA